MIEPPTIWMTMLKRQLEDKHRAHSDHLPLGTNQEHEKLSVKVRETSSGAIMGCSVLTLGIGTDE